MRYASLGILAVLAGALGAAGCNNDAAPIEFDELTARFGGAYCGYATRCGSTGNFEQYVLHSSITNCASQTGTFLANTQFARFQEAIDLGTIHYDSASAGRCLASFDSLGCGTALNGPPPGCDQTFTGTVADGSPCTLNEECSGHSSCVGAGSTCGTCTHTPQIGETCTNNCDTGAYCNAGTCAAQIASGGACDPHASGSCGSGLRCNAPETDPTHGTCMADARAMAGQPCGSAGCATGLVCALNGTMTTCRAPRTDGSCQGVLSGSDCGAGMTCSAALGMTGTCMAYPMLGQACAGVCAAPARCVAMVCHASGQLGETCATGADCLSGVCDASTCAPQPLCTP